MERKLQCTHVYLIITAILICNPQNIKPLPANTGVTIFCSSYIKVFTMDIASILLLPPLFQTFYYLLNIDLKIPLCNKSTIYAHPTATGFTVRCCDQRQLPELRSAGTQRKLLKQFPCCLQVLASASVSRTTRAQQLHQLMQINQWEKTN